MKRITQKNLEQLVERINHATGNPLEYSAKDVDGKYKTNPGNYHLSYAYGGVALDQLCNTSGGVRRVSTTGYGTKRELYNWMQAYLSGLHSDKKAV